MSCDDTRMFSSPNENEIKQTTKTIEFRLSSWLHRLSRKRKKKDQLKLFERINWRIFNDFVAIILNLYISEDPSFSFELAR